MINLDFTKQNFTKFYRKIFCTECSEFSIRMLEGDIVECFNGCEVHLEKVEEDNFNGFFNRDEIEELFYFNEKIQLENFLKFSKPISFGNIRKEEGDRLNYLFEKKKYTEIDIDDVVVNYMINEGITVIPEKPTNFGYIINLIEDIHYFLLRACQDLALFDITLEVNKTKENQPFYSARFFFYNAIEAIWYAFERIVVYLGLKYGFKFKNKLEANGTFKITDFLSKELDEKTTPIYKELFIYNQKSAKFISSIRIDNTHNSSIHIQEINKIASNKNAKKMFEEKNANYFDGVHLKPKVNKTISAVEQLYSVFLEIVKDAKLNCNQFDNLQIPMKDEYEKYTLYEIQINETFNIKGIDFRKNAAFNMLIQLPKGDKKYNLELQLLWDIFFRLEETQKCIVDVYRLEENTFEGYWNHTIGMDISSFIDKRMFIYASMSRIYSAYDKFSQYYASARGPENIKYFKNLKSVTPNNNDEVLNTVKRILNSDEYLGLSKFRNRIAHNLSAGILYGDRGLKSENALIYYCIVKLVNDCFDLLFEEAKQKLE